MKTDVMKRFILMVVMAMMAAMEQMQMSGRDLRAAVWISSRSIRARA